MPDGSPQAGGAGITATRFDVSRWALVPMTDEEFATVKREGLVLLPHYEWPEEPEADPIGVADECDPVAYVNLFFKNLAAVRAQRGRLVVIAVVDLAPLSPATDDVLIEHVREAAEEALDR